MGNQRELTVLLIEDDKFACEEIRNYIDQLDDMRLLGITDDSNKALDMVKYCVPDAIILDLELHEGGGNGLFFLSKLRPWIRKTALYPDYNAKHQQCDS